MNRPLPPGYRLVDVPENRYTEWLDCWLGTFGSPPGGSPEVVDFFRGTHPPERAVAITDETGYVATNTSLNRDMVLPGGNTIGIAACTGGSVHPTLTRGGLMRATLNRLHERAVEEGRALAAGGVTEWPIYERFGYGPAIWYNSVSIDVRAAGWHSNAPDGGLPLRRVDGQEARGIARTLYSRQAAKTPGEVFPPECYWDRFTTDPVNSQLDEALGLTAPGAGARRCVAVEDRGLVSYRIVPGWTPETAPQNTLQVVDFLATDAEAAAALWRHVLSVDLVAEVEVWRLPVDDPLPWWVTDARRVRSRRQDGLWLRPLDVPSLLETRGWTGGGALTLAVHDSDGYAEGTFRLEVEEGRGRCSRTTAEADLEMDVAALGAILLGGTSATALARSGRIRARDPRSAQTWDAIAVPERAPFLSYWF